MGAQPRPLRFVPQTGLSGNLILLSVLYKGGLLMGSAHMTVGELSSFLMYAFWVGLSIAGAWPARGSGCRGRQLLASGVQARPQRLSSRSFCAKAIS